MDKPECPIETDDFYEKYNLYSYATVPNVSGFADQFKLDYVGKCWALSKELNVETDDYLPLTMLPYSFGPGDESLENFDYYVNQWEKGTKAEKNKTIKMLKKAIKDAD